MAHTDIVIIGAEEFLPGFALAGARRIVLASKRDVLKEIAEHKDAGVIILDDRITAELTAAQRQELETSVAPVIITLSRDSAEKRKLLRRSIMGTFGVDLLK